MPTGKVKFTDEINISCTRRGDGNGVEANVTPCSPNTPKSTDQRTDEVEALVPVTEWQGCFYFPKRQQRMLCKADYIGGWSSNSGLQPTHPGCRTQPRAPDSVSLGQAAAG